MYAYVRSWVTEEYNNIHFPSWKGVDDYQDPFDPSLLSANFLAVFLEVPSVINYHLEWSVILNDITQNNNKVLRDDIKKCQFP